MRTLRISLPSLLLKSPSSVLVLCFARRVIERRSAVLAEKTRQRCRCRHAGPCEYAFFTASRALADQERKMLGATRVLAADSINPSATQAFKFVGVFVPTERAQHQQHAQPRKLFRGIHFVFGFHKSQRVPCGGANSVRVPQPTPGHQPLLGNLLRPFPLHPPVRLVWSGAAPIIVNCEYRCMGTRIRCFVGKKAPLRARRG